MILAQVTSYCAVVVSRVLDELLECAFPQWATSTVYVIASKAKQKEALAHLEKALEDANLPARDYEIHAFGNDSVEIETVIALTSVDGAVLDAVIKELAGRKQPHDG